MSSDEGHSPSPAARSGTHSNGSRSPVAEKNGNGRATSRSRSGSGSRSPVRRRSASRSPVRGRSSSRDRRTRRSQSGDRRRNRSRSRSSRVRRRSRSYSGSPPRRRSRSPRRSSYGYSRYSPRRSRYNDGRDNPEPCACLGVFGMSLNTSERDLKRIFGEYGEIETVQLVYDRYSGRSRGFGFVYFQTTKEAMRAKEHLRDAVIDGMRVRVDFSVTKGAPTYGKTSRRSRSRSADSYRRRRSRS
uniref:Transformer-2 protein beta n=1 Tax=Ascaris suum TaxID=6253 RepID=F1LA85_ASCSU